LQVEKNKVGFTITLVIVTAIILLYSLATSSLNAFMELLSIDTLIAASILTLGWLISAVRLRILIQSYTRGDPIPLLDSLKIRLIGGLLANITPSALGGEPARAYYISRRIGASFVESFAIAIYEVYYDVIAVNAIALAFSMQYLPVSLPILLVALFMVTTWLSASLKISRTRSRPLEALPQWIPGFLRKPVEALYKRYIEFATSYSSVSSMLPTRVKTVLWVLTIAYHTIWGLAALAFLHSLEFNTVIGAVKAYFLMQSFSSLPTPGGSGAAEYGLSIVLNPLVVVKYRVTYYYYTIILGLVASITYSETKASIIGRS